MNVGISYINKMQSINFCKFEPYVESIVEP